MTRESSSDTDELFVTLFARYERDLRAFVRSTGLDWDAVDEVIQTVSLVMWRKWDEFDPDSDFLRWARVIARFEVLKYRRTLARDRHVFREDLVELLADAAEDLEEKDGSEAQRRALRQCLDTLPEKSRRLLATAYAGDRTLREVAAEAGQSATAFYKTLDRLRKKLRACIEQRLAVQG